MTVVASLVMGRDGSTTPSHLISNTIDQADFRSRRKLVDCILIGGNTARTEKYENTPVPLVVLTRNSAAFKGSNVKATYLSLEPSEAITQCRALHGTNIGVEVGPHLLLEMLNAHLIDELHLTITDKTGASDIHSPDKFLIGLQIETDVNHDRTRLIVARKQR